MPRADRSADILALEATPGALFAPQAVYTRVEGELQAATAAFPWVQSIGAVADFPPDILAGFDGGARRAVAADGGYHAWDCLNSMYGGTVGSIGDLVAMVSFAPVLDMMQLYETYSRLPPPLEWASPNAYGGGWSDICLSAEPQGDVFIIGRAEGDCPAGCGMGEITGVQASSDGGVSLLGRWNGRDGVPLPAWLTTRGEVCRAHFGAVATWVEPAGAGDAGLASWRWVQPSPAGLAASRAVWGNAPDDVWVAGSDAFGGAVQHWDGGTWTSALSAAPHPLTALWASGPSDVWAVGKYGYAGSLLHWNGSAWASVSSGTHRELIALWGSGAGDAWAVGDIGTILHWDGMSWTQMPSGTLERLMAVWGNGQTDVWAVGHAGTILHWDGMAWTQVPSGTSERLTAVWGSGPNDVWVAGLPPNGCGPQVSCSTIRHWNGMAWSDRASGAAALSTYRFESLTGTGPADVWAVGERGAIHWNGVTWAEAPTALGPLSGSGRAGPAHLWAVGDARLWRWDGSAWQERSGSGPTSNFSAVWGSGPNDVWVAGGYGTNVDLRHWDGSAWTDRPTGSPQGLTALWGTGPNDVWAVGWSTSGLPSAIKRWNGTSWTDAAQGFRYVQPMGIWGSAATDVWVVGYAGAAHWDGASWAHQSSGLTSPSGAVASLLGVWGTAPDDVWAVGAGAWHWTGASWTNTSGPTNLRAVWGAGPNEVWAVGVGAWHWTGASWVNTLPNAQDLQLTDVWGSGPNDVWAVGTLVNANYQSLSSRLLHWNGASWATISTMPGVVELRGVWGSGPGDFWAVGPEGTVLRGP